MINVNKLIKDFKSLNYDQKKEKIINFLDAINKKTWQFWDLLNLFIKVKNIPEQLLIETYIWLVEYWRDMNDIKIKEKMGRTAFILQKIWEQEAKEKVEEEEELKILEKIIDELWD